MADSPSIRTDGISAAHHNTVASLPVRVAPSTADQRNVVFTGIVPIACWRVEDLRFDFGSSFITPGLREEIIHLRDLRNAHKVDILTDSGKSVTLYPPISIFGHADPTGNDDFNKQLSGRRATAVYAMLTRKTDLWKSLHDTPLGTDTWGSAAVQTMRVATANATPTPYAKLYADYMDWICGADFRLDPEDDFLSRGSNPSGKGDYQGCGEFNPVRIFSQAETGNFARPENKEQRNLANAVNRRVMVLLFPPATYVNSARWPCPHVKEGTAGCHKRFWSDSETRRKNQAVRRDYKGTEDTFACRFYDRITGDSPCERRNSAVQRVFQLQIRDHNRTPLKNCAYTLVLNGRRIEDSTDGEGYARFQRCVDGKGSLEVNGQCFDLTFEDSIPDDVSHAQALLNALGFNAGPLDGILGRRTEDALKSFQRVHKLPPKGKLDDATWKLLREEQIIRDLDNDQAGAPERATRAAPPKQKARVRSAPRSTAPPAALVEVKGADAAGDPTPAAPSATPTVVRTDSTSRVDLTPPHDELSAAILRRFDDIDTDKDGFLSKNEIDIALGKTSFTAADAAMVATLKKLLGDFEEFSNDEWGSEDDGITKADVTAYDRLREKDSTNETIRKIFVTFGFAKQKIAGTANALFVGDPTFLKVNQGLIGDCWFLAALVGVGLRNKADILRMAAPSSGSTTTFTVTFPGVKKALTVEKPTDGELAIFATVGANGFWLPLLEKSYGTAINQDKYVFVDTSTTDTMDGGKVLDEGIEVMTGHDCTNNMLSFSRESVIRKQLADAFANQKIVTAGIRKNVPLAGHFRDNGLPMGHAYTVISFDGAADKIKLRNPWGYAGPASATIVDGVFEMTMTDFFKNYTMVATED